MNGAKIGKTVDSFDELDILMNRDGANFVLDGKKILHRKFIDQMSFATLRDMIIRERIRVLERR